MGQHNQAQAVALWKGRVPAVGTDAEIMTLKGDSTQVIDLGGKLLLPGFDDGRMHFADGGFFLQGLDLKNRLQVRGVWYGIIGRQP